MKTTAANPPFQQFTLDNDNTWFYSVQPCEIKNALGAVVATLDEYLVNNVRGEIYKMYKTPEGFWFDIPGANPVEKGVLLRTLKIAIDLHLKKANSNRAPA